MKRTLKTQIGGALAVAMLGSAAISNADPLDTWTIRDSGTGRNLFGSTYANGIFVVVGESGTILTSADGTTWTSRTSATSENLHDVAYGNGVFVATGGSDEDTLGNALVISPDGVTWTKRTVPAVGPIYSLTFGGGKFVAVGYTEYYERPVSTVLVSSDGLSWTSQSALTNTYFPAITYGAGTFVAVGDDYAVDFGDHAGIFTSQDGVIWTQRIVPYGRMRGVAYGKGLYVVMGQDGTILTSSNAVAWTSRNSGATNDFKSVAYGGGTFTAVADGWISGGIYTGPTQLRSSTNGIIWTAPAFHFTNTCSTISYGSGGFIVAGHNGTVAQSGFIGPPVLTALRYRAGIGFELTLRGEIGRSYRVQTLTNLTASNWVTVSSVTLTQPVTNFVDSAATNTNHRIYRAVSP